MLSRRFELGRLVATPAALAALEASGEPAATYLARHATGERPGLRRYTGQRERGHPVTNVQSVDRRAAAHYSAAAGFDSCWPKLERSTYRADSSGWMDV